MYCRTLLYNTLTQLFCKSQLADMILIHVSGETKHAIAKQQASIKGAD